MDKRALKILFDAYWSPSGWNRGEPRLSTEDFEYAKAQRAMFDPVTPTHDEAISRLRAAVERLKLHQVADGFLASLSTRRLEWRSALGSYSVARWMPEHEATARSRPCSRCSNARSFVPSISSRSYETTATGRTPPRPSGTEISTDRDQGIEAPVLVDVDFNLQMSQSGLRVQRAIGVRDAKNLRLRDQVANCELYICHH